MEGDRLDDPAGNGIGILRELRFGRRQILDVIHNDCAGIVNKRPGFDQFARIEKALQIFTVHWPGRQPPLFVVCESNIERINGHLVEISSFDRTPAYGSVVYLPAEPTRAPIWTDHRDRSNDA